MPRLHPRVPGRRDLDLAQSVGFSVRAIGCVGSFGHLMAFGILDLWVP